MAKWRSSKRGETKVPSSLIFFGGFVVLLFLLQTALKEEDNSAFSRRSGRELLISLKPDQGMADRFLNQQLHSPRYTYFTSNRTLTRINATFCDPDSSGTCQFEQYVESVFLIPLMAGVVGLIALITCPFFWVCRCCLCGGYKASKGICIPGEEFEVSQGDGYSTMEVWILRIISWFMLATCVSFSIVGFVGNYGFHTDIHNFTDTVVNAGVTILDDMVQIETTMNDLQAALLVNDTIGSQISDGIKFGNDTLTYVQSIKDQIYTYEGYREAALLVPFILCILLFASLGIAACICNGKVACVMAVGGFFGIFIMFFTFMIHYPIAVIVADLCNTINTANQQQSQNGSTSVLDVLVNCKDVAAIAQLRNLADKAYNESITYGCDALNQYCAEKLPCPGTDPTSTPNCSIANCGSLTCSSSSLPSFLNLSIADYVLGCPQGVDSNNVPQFPTGYCPWDINYPCTYLGNGPLPLFVCNLTYAPLSACDSNCTSPQSKKIAHNLLIGINGEIGFGKLVTNVIDPLLSCELITQVINTAKDDLCVALVDWLFYISFSSVFLGALFFPGVVVAVLSIKRFDRQNMQGHSDDHF